MTVYEARYKGTKFNLNFCLQAQETHFLEVEIRDMGGASNGLFSKGVARVSLTDINDNPPTFTQTTVSSLQSGFLC